MKLEGIRVWDGDTEIGSCRVSWSVEGFQDLTVGPGNADLEGLSLIPGLIDTHVHLIHDARDVSVSPDARRAWRVITPGAEQILHGTANALRAMRAGVTTLFDKAADERQVGIGRVFDEGIIPGPRVYTNCAVGMTGGHGDLFLPPAVKERGPLADGVVECRRLVRHWARTGSYAIKIMTSGGVLSVGDKNSWRNHTRDEVAAIVDEAHALGMQVAAHAHTEEGIQTAIDEGVDGIEHATTITKAQAQQVAQKGITLGPTLVILDKIVRGEMPANPEQRAKAEGLYAQRDGCLRAAKDLGVTFRLATDSSGRRLSSEAMEETRAMCAVIGLTAEQSLRAATSVAAKAMNIDATVGAVRPGQGADFVVLRGSPWKNIDDLRVENIVAVVCRGRVVHGALPS